MKNITVLTVSITTTFLLACGCAHRESRTYQTGYQGSSYLSGTTDNRSDQSVTSDNSAANTKGAGARALTSGDSSATFTPNDRAQGGTGSSSDSTISSSSSSSRNYSTAGGSSGLSSQDSNFIKEAAQAGLAEVKMGELAQQNAQDQSLKDFGQKLVSDHQKANQELMALASQKGFTAPSEMSSKESRMLEHLQSLNGTQFDAACGKEAVMAHEKAVKLFKKEAQSGQDPEVKAFAEKTLPTLEEHLATARSLNGNSNNSSSTTSSESRTQNRETQEQK